MHRNGELVKGSLLRPPPGTLCRGGRGAVVVVLESVFHRPPKGLPRRHWEKQCAPPISLHVTGLFQLFSFKRPSLLE